MLSEWVLERVASFLGGLFAVGLTESGRARAANRRRFLSGFRVISGRQPGLSRERLIGEVEEMPGVASVSASGASAGGGRVSTMSPSR